MFTNTNMARRPMRHSLCISLLASLLMWWAVSVVTALEPAHKLEEQNRSPTFSPQQYDHSSRIQELKEEIVRLKALVMERETTLLVEQKQYIQEQRTTVGGGHEGQGENKKYYNAEPMPSSSAVALNRSNIDTKSMLSLTHHLITDMGTYHKGVVTYHNGVSCSSRQVPMATLQKVALECNPPLCIEMLLENFIRGWMLETDPTSCLTEGVCWTAEKGCHCKYPSLNLAEFRAAFDYSYVQTDGDSVTHMFATRLAKAVLSDFSSHEAKIIARYQAQIMETFDPPTKSSNGKGRVNHQKAQKFYEALKKPFHDYLEGKREQPARAMRSSCTPHTGINTTFMAYTCSPSLQPSPPPLPGGGQRRRLVETVTMPAVLEMPDHVFRATTQGMVWFNSGLHLLHTFPGRIGVVQHHALHILYYENIIIRRLFSYLEGARRASCGPKLAVLYRQTNVVCDSGIVANWKKALGRLRGRERPALLGQCAGAFWPNATAPGDDGCLRAPALLGAPAQALACGGGGGGGGGGGDGGGGGGDGVGGGGLPSVGALLRDLPARRRAVCEWGDFTSRGARWLNRRAAAAVAYVNACLADEEDGFWAAAAAAPAARAGEEGGPVFLVRGAVPPCPAALRGAAAAAAAGGGPRVLPVLTYRAGELAEGVCGYANRQREKTDGRHFAALEVVTLRMVQNLFQQMARAPPPAAAAAASPAAAQ